MSIKKLYIYIIKTFLPLLLVSFSISWFVVVMQLLWRFVDDLVGKGIDAIIFVKLMFYAAMTVVPLSLILAILVASLMTFGNLGERLELLAMKSAGVPLYTIMKPIFISVIVISVGLFIFQNDWMIKSQVKFWTYYFSIRNKSPELAIPEGVFYKDLSGYSIYVKEKNSDSKLLKGLMIYDYRSGINDATVILADSGRIYSTKDNKALILELYRGESFKNLRKPSYVDPQELIPYLREKFRQKTVHINFDSNMDMFDEGAISSQFVGKNIIELRQFSDSLQYVVDSLEVVAAREVVGNSYQTRFLSVETGSYSRDEVLVGEDEDAVRSDTDEIVRGGDKQSLSIAESYPSKFKGLPVPLQQRFSMKKRLSDMGMKEMINLYTNTAELISNRLSMTSFSRSEREGTLSTLRKNEFEFHRKITYPVACIVFFFIGAPLGAIIRKGGLGTPIVTAVLFFIIYYVLETMGLKMAKDGKVEVWIGMWLPSMVLAPIGLWLSYIAAKDSAKLNLDNYINAVRKVLGTSTIRKIVYKDITMTDVDYLQATKDLEELEVKVKNHLSSPAMSYADFFLNNNGHLQRQDIFNLTEKVVDNLSNSRDYLLINRLANYPYLKDLSRTLRLNNRIGNLLLMVLFPLGLTFYGIYLYRTKAYRREMNNILITNKQIVELLPGNNE
ncbi:MAG: LptF/LptG family permease [Porphyromonas sp.]|nr:LptF/LptG family permease [Porphyromonas sp.]